MEVMNTKKCAQCGQEKPIEDFSKSYKNMCKSCVAENVKAKRHNPTLYLGRGLSMPVPEDATFISPMRFQASVVAMQGLLAGGMKRGVIARSIELADALINELKKPKDELEEH